MLVLQVVESIGQEMLDAHGYANAMFRRSFLDPHNQRVRQIYMEILLALVLLREAGKNQLGDLSGSPGSSFHGESLSKIRLCNGVILPKTWLHSAPR